MSATDSDLEDLGLEWDHDLAAEERDRIEVSGINDDMVRADSGELVVAGLSKCLGLAVYDHSSEIGYAAHFVTAENSTDDLVEYLEDFNTLLMMDDVDYQNLEIMIAGIDYSDEVSDRFLGEEREIKEIESEGAKRAIAEKYAERYFSDTEVRWDVEDGMNSGIILDIDEGILEYDSSYGQR